jgi:predicted GNAT family N-acyltransferase
VPAEPNYQIVALGPSHERSAFCSGVPELDEYLHHHAGQDAKRRVATPFVLVDTSGSILGYYILSAYGVRLEALPSAISKRLPRYPLIPATLLGRLAVSSAARGRRLGKLLLMDALHRSWRNTAAVASVGVVVDALDDAARSFYLHHEFIPLLDHPDRLFLAMATIEKAFQPR